jgi:hypothetical protein
MIVAEEKYTISISATKEIMVSIAQRETEQSEDCRILYDGKDHAIFYRAKGEVILLDYVTDGFKLIAPVEGQVYLAEREDEKLKKVYVVPVKMVEVLPKYKTHPRPESEIMQEIEEAAQNGNIQEVGDRILSTLE